MLQLVRASTFALLCPLAMAQALLLTPGLPTNATKVVTHDYGGFWPGALVRHTDGKVTAVGNPWLGGGSEELLLSGVNDMARLDAFVPGAGEGVAIVGAAGLQHVRWDPIECKLITPMIDAGAAGAQIVRAAPFAPHHTVVVVPANGMSLRIYRSSTLVATPTVAGPVRDVEIFRDAANGARLLLRTDAGLTCTNSGGAFVHWTLPGIGGELARWPQSASGVRAAWVHREDVGGPWVLQLLDDAGAGAQVDLAFAIAPSEDVLAVFAVDDGLDGDIDLVVKTTAGASVIENLGAPGFTTLTEVPVTNVISSAISVPDLLVTHAGHRLRLVDATGAGSLAWNRVDVSHGAASEDITLFTRTVGEETVGGLVSPPGAGTRIAFDVQTTNAALAPFVVDGMTTHLQVVPWRQGEWGPNGRLDEVSESNTTFELDFESPVSDPVWPLEATLDQELSQPAGSTDWCWTEDLCYWITVRLCTVGPNGPVAVSEPITLVTSLSVGQSPDWGFLTQYAPTPMPVLGLNSILGGGVVGIIQKTNVPPPPLPNGLPTPADAMPFSEPISPIVF